LLGKQTRRAVGSLTRDREVGTGKVRKLKNETRSVFSDKTSQSIKNKQNKNAKKIDKN